MCKDFINRILKSAIHNQLCFLYFSVPNGTKLLPQSGIYAEEILEDFTASGEAHTSIMVKVIFE